MFVGSINQDMRSVLAELAAGFRGLPVYVGCSGNFTCERVLAREGIGGLHSNDVSLYSCALGAFLAGKPFPLGVQDERLAWLRDWLSPGLPAVATLLLCTTILEYWDRDHPYHGRMWAAYLRRWPELHATTVEKLRVGLEGVRLADFHAGDVVDFLAAAPDESVVISFPPTYKAGYERLYRKLQATFSWESPTYPLFTADRFQALIERMTAKRVWLVSRDEPVAGLAGFEVASVQTGMRSRPVWMYSNRKLARVTLPRQKTEPVPWPRVEADPAGPIELVPLTGPQLNTLRSEYLSPLITPAGALLQFGVLAGGRLFGALAYSSPNAGLSAGWCDSYMMTDLAVKSPVPRLSKLVVAAALSTEVRAALEEKQACRVETVGTTAFTDRPVSMKYRGVMDLYSRKPGMLNYVGRAGRWTLAEAFAWWQRTQRQS